MMAYISLITDRTPVFLSKETVIDIGYTDMTSRAQPARNSVQHSVYDMFRSHLPIGRNLTV